MDALYEKYKDKDVEFYTVYTQEPHTGEKMRSYDFSDRKQTKTVDDRVNYAKILVGDHGLKRPIVIDGFAKDNLPEYAGRRCSEQHAPHRQRRKSGTLSAMVRSDWSREETR